MRQKYDYARLLKDYNIPFNSEEAAGRGFLTLPCPYCRGQSHKNKGYYGGINIQHNYFRCWKCGKKPLYEVIRLLTGREWREIEDEYKTMLDPRDIYLSRVAEKPKKTKEIRKILPKFCSDLGPVPAAYLTSRGFDPAYLQKKYGIMATGPLGSYKFRIIIPIYHQGKIVSFQGRDYTGQTGLRYKACSMENEIIHHKHLLYGEQFVDSEHIIVVEGPFDQWKMGNNSVALFGTGYTNQQVNLLLKYKKISILFDPEGEAKRHANILGDRLAGLGSEVDLIFLNKGDPGELPVNEAAQLKREILNNI